MVSTGRAVLYGFLVWVLRALAAVIALPLKPAGSPMFGTVVPIGLTVGAVLFGALYLRRVATNLVAESVRLAVLWSAMRLLLDLVVMVIVRGSAKLPVANYLEATGLTYLIVPVVVVGFGYLLQNRSERSLDAP